MTAEMENRIIGVDVGGANLKYATSSGLAASSLFPMWRQPNLLAKTVVEDVRSHFKNLLPINRLAVTMTGELADCFLDRGVGVSHIVSHLCRAAEILSIDETLFYGVDGVFHDANRAVAMPDQVAAGNWHALANLIGREVARDATLIDVGSTTTDIIPIVHGNVATRATTDFDRLCEGSLVYVGCRRTPVCALVNTLDFRGSTVPVMNEHFATIDDAMLLLGEATEDVDDCDSADGKPRTCFHATTRMARMIGLDQRNASLVDVKPLALQVAQAAIDRVAEGLNRVGLSSNVVISGHGSRLVELPDQLSILYLADAFGEDVARSAPAYAVARLRQFDLEVAG